MSTRSTTSSGAARTLAPGATVLDLGSGYGGPARYPARTFGCQVIALNVSEA
ncbi:hypothetical protein AB0D04_13780 [Streptomyces sp. NPDC048483]|uniref:SAM-dependent methyltransferase n=1 Tax=Streptomyces sp. NPDC048483 TaxID=3154927 RepID=UPI00341B5996